MKAIVAFLFALIPLTAANAADNVSDQGVRSQANMLAKAAGLPPMPLTRYFRLRVWSGSYMTGSVKGVIIAGGIVTVYQGTRLYKDGKDVVNLAQVGGAVRVANIRQLKRNIIALLPYDKSSVSCGFLDGGWVLVDATLDGRSLTYEADNPWICKDNASKLTMKLLDILPH